MDKYSYLVELNNFLDYKFAGIGAVSGSSSGIHFSISFSDDSHLTVTASIRLFGDLPYREHIDSTFKKMSWFYSYALEEDRLELFSERIEDNDSALTISQDITMFAKTLSELGYKDSVQQTETDAGNEQDGQNQQLQQAALGIIPIQDEREQALPSRMAFGIFGAIIAAGVALGLFFLLGIINSLWTFTFGAILVVVGPAVFYELFSRQKTSAVQIVICLFLSVVALLAGDRLVWAFCLLQWYPGIDFAIAYWEVPYMVEDGIVEAFDYYRDYLIMFFPLVVFYGIFIRNYLTNGMTILQLMTAKKKR